ncbi:MAG TPA: ATP-binding protein [Ilumatobacteraceae bacterium]|nr:ATP-binding protein [Ilumatobacteraceae bacterium]
MAERASIGPVVLRMPPDPTLSRVLRLAASGIAGMAGFTIDEIEDIKIAVSEVMLALIEHGGGQSIEVQFMVEDQAFTVRGQTEVESFDTEHPDLLLCRTVLASVTSQHGIDRIGDQAQIWAAVAHASIT